MNADKQIPQSIASIPVALLKPAELRKLERAAFKLSTMIDKLRKRMPEVRDESNHQSALWQRLYQARKAADVAKAEREEVLWTVFAPRSYGLVEVQRTKHWRITRFWNKKYPLFGEPYSVRGEADASKVLLFEDPTRDFQKAQVAA